MIVDFLPKITYFSPSKISINLNIQEVRCGSYEPTLSHSETKKNTCVIVWSYVNFEKIFKIMFSLV